MCYSFIFFIKNKNNFFDDSTIVVRHREDDDHFDRCKTHFFLKNIYFEKIFLG